MNDAQEIIQKLIGSVRRPRSTSSFFLNGLPGSGKSRLLQSIAEQLPAAVPRMLVLGPYLADSAETLCPLLVQDCLANGLISEEPPEALVDFSSMWHWLTTNLQAADKSLLVLLEVPIPIEAGSAAANLLSAIRALENQADGRRFGLHHVVAGFWSHAALETYFKHINVSFPYTAGHNYKLWAGITETGITEMIPAGNHRELRGKLLWELTDGYPAAAQDILQCMGDGELTMASLIEATRAAAQNSPTALKLCTIWKGLPPEPLDLLRRMLNHRHVKVATNLRHADDLLTYGLARWVTVGEAHYLGFRSWYVELVAWLHMAELGLDNGKIGRVPPDELIPELTTFNREAFQLIYDIETTARHFAITYLYAHRKDNEHILRKFAESYDTQKGSVEDAYSRATDWRARSEKKGLLTAHNPLITYCTTRDLAKIISDIGYESRTDAWKPIADAIEKLADVRDAVMHHQLIDLNTLKQLYALQVKMYNLVDTQTNGAG